MVCYNWGYVLFENALYNWYEDDCVLACHCEEPETGRTTSSSTNSTWSSADSKDQDWAEENAQLMREHYATLNGHSALRMNRTHNRLNTQLPCRAGEAAGWVFESRALKDCCPGYLFNALTAQEAYVNYGVPISYIIAGVISIGICLKPKPG